MYFLAYALAILVIASALGILWCVWGLYCNEQTSKQRQKLIDAAYRRNENMTAMENWLENKPLRNEYESVTYDEHMRSLMLFRDWRELYPILGKMV